MTVSKIYNEDKKLHKYEKSVKNKASFLFR